MTQIIDLTQIKSVLEGLDLSGSIEEGFIAYSRNEVVVPPVGEMTFDRPPGDTHIKYGYIKGADHYVIKIASGFYENPALGLPSNSGLMLVFSSRTGGIETILLDEGYLTDVRTALAGQVAARYLAPEEVRTIGILGTGIQARMQVQYLAPVTTCKDLVVWGRTAERAEQYKADMEALGYRVALAREPGDVAAQANLIVTATPSQTPLLSVDHIRPGTHITAMGSDTSQKQELDEKILEMADLVVADSIAQCKSRGEIAKALAAGCIKEEKILELGRIIEATQNQNGPDGSPDRTGLARTAADQITVADLTGVAVQDIQIATAVCRSVSRIGNGRTAS